MGKTQGMIKPLTQVLSSSVTALCHSISAQFLLSVRRLKYYNYDLQLQQFLKDMTFFYLILILHWNTLNYKQQEFSRKHPNKSNIYTVKSSPYTEAFVKI